ncbi:response regulator transcription factor [Marinobacter sp. UBA2498]|jgi:DNA-binding CsgD family transcriptional regulator|uniref:response regulator transcription factor n=1 Tax=Marinobacter sp. UBA2498 TaxID=1946813 RepID=UPI0025803148|nr:helix-turn-helix transcriptional regulator [Marinobacter sp. UBA2498]|tara:strand:+ start:3637 stop:4065 length:429 start_codon:yes stop_codon:yes gene_type:complete
METVKGSEFEIQDPNNTLTPRQRQVLAWVVEGKENEAIATILGITLGTVKFHMIHLLRRFDAPNRQLLISRAWKAGLVKVRQLAIGLLILGNAMPGGSDQPVTVRTPRITRIRVTNRREPDDHPIVMPTNRYDLLSGDREAA